MLSKLRHPKVILFLGASINTDSNDMIIVTEYMEGGKKKTKKKDFRLDWSCVRLVVKKDFKKQTDIVPTTFSILQQV